MTEDEFKGWLSNVINTITKPITVSGINTGISPLDIGAILVGK
jgi:hypothetical protein